MQPLIEMFNSKSRWPWPRRTSVSLFINFGAGFQFFAVLVSPIYLRLIGNDVGERGGETGTGVTINTSLSIVTSTKRKKSGLVADACVRMGVAGLLLNKWPLLSAIATSFLSHKQTNDFLQHV